MRLREKFGTERWQPVSPALAASLAQHAEARGVREPEEWLLRHADGTPLSGSRYDLLWKRVKNHLHWAAKLGVSMHWLRHTTLTYIKGVPHEVARALSAYTREPHPLAVSDRLMPLRAG